MSSGGGIIRASVSMVNDLCGTLGIASNTTLKNICISSQINKWAKYKPLNLSSATPLTEAQRSAAYYGLSAQRNTAAQNIYMGSVTATEANFNAAVSSSYDWIYTKPSSRWRVSDFLNNANPTSDWGYVHGTEPPFALEGNWTFNKTKLSNVANVYYTDNVNHDNNLNNWELQIWTNYQQSQQLTSGEMFTGYKARWGTASQDNINGASTYVIPITYLLGSSVTNENWRMGMLVWVPACSGFNAEAGLFVSKATIKYAHANGSGSASGSVVNLMSVDLATNQLLAQHMVACMGSASTMNFRALPVLVKNARIAYTNAWQQGQGHGRSYIANTMSGADYPEIYSMPCGTTEVGIDIASGGGGGDTSDATSGPWTLGTKFSGTYVSNGSSESIRPINQLCIFMTNNTPGVATTFDVNIDYQTTSPSGVTTTHTTNQTYSCRGGQQFTSNNTQYYGIVLTAGPALVIKTIRTFVHHQ